MSIYSLILHYLSIISLLALFIVMMCWLKKIWSESSKETTPQGVSEWLLKIKEMKQIEKENFKTLGDLKVFLNDPQLSFADLKETVVQEFNRHASSEEQISLNLSEKIMRKTILEKAEQYYVTSDPLLEILVESFLAETHHESRKKN